MNTQIIHSRAFAIGSRFEQLEPRLLLSSVPLLDPQISGFDGDTSMYVYDASAAELTEANVDYLLTDHWGGAYADAEKTIPDTDDDLMCWAASASNMLEWSGWGFIGGMGDTDEMFE